MGETGGVFEEVILELSHELDVAKEGTRFVCVGIQHLINRARQQP